MSRLRGLPKSGPSDKRASINPVRTTASLEASPEMNYPAFNRGIMPPTFHRRMCRALLIAFWVCLTGCVKTTLPPFSHVTRAEVRSCRSQYDYFGSITAPNKLSALLDFVDRPRPSWTRTFIFDFGVPRALVRADLYDGDTYLGYIAVGGGMLPGNRAFFEVRRGKIRAPNSSDFGSERIY